MREKVIITCAVTGSSPVKQRPGPVPVTPEEIARAAIEAGEAGAAIAHIHVRDPITARPSMDPALYRVVVERIRASGAKILINLTTGPGARYIPSAEDPQKPAAGTTLTTPQVRIAHVLELKPEICSLDIGSFNFNERVFINTPDHLTVMAERVQAAGVLPELECFDTGFVRFGASMIADGLIKKPALFQLVLGIRWGAEASLESLVAMRSLIPPGSNWAAFGPSRLAFPMVAQAVLAGGHVRVGMEDTYFIEKGKPAPGNAALVERAVQIIRLLGADVMSPAEARAELGLPPRP